MQLFHVLVLTDVAMLMASAILQLVFVIVTLECKDLIVQVNIFGLCTSAKHPKTYVSKILEFICPGNCSNAGSCDTSSGQCLCNDGRHGMDCSSNFDTYFTLSESGVGGLRKHLFF